MPWTPLGELTTLPLTSSQLGRGIPSPHSPPHLELGGNLLQGLRGIDTPE